MVAPDCTLNIQNDPQSKCLWYGLFHVRELPGFNELEDSLGAYVTLVGWASSIVDFVLMITRELPSQGLEAISVDGLGEMMDTIEFDDAYLVENIQYELMGELEGALYTYGTFVTYDTVDPEEDEPDCDEETKWSIVFQVSFRSERVLDAPGDALVATVALATSAENAVLKATKALMAVDDCIVVCVNGFGTLADLMGAPASFLEQANSVCADKPVIYGEFVPYTP